ncbi:MAG TPA: FAD-dependent oxidoreductase [Bacteroidales bacterium]|nr:FAD-dependent oxidoreductase [Bacteroidales bacterium]
MIHYDYLIVGQGIAGTLLSHFLLKRGKKILVADEFRPSASSLVAAGICNPVTGKRFVKTWKADVIFPFAETVYREMEQHRGKKFYHQKNITKKISGNEALEFFRIKYASGELDDAIRLPNDGAIPDRADSLEFEITGGGYLDMAGLIGEYRQLLVSKEAFVEQAMTGGDLHFEDDGIIWAGNHFARVIFCEGYRAMFNPFFSHLPFVPAKGEILTIHSPALQLHYIVMKDLFVLPLGNHFYKAGATYKWNTLDETPSAEGLAELKSKLDRMLDCSYTITEHQAGIRPTVKDRMPLLGMHGVHKNIGIFNGLGTKGASLAPYLANHFVQHLEDGKSLDKEVDIQRFNFQ